MNNIGELFKILNSDLCNKFYENVNDNNKKDIIDTMLNNEEFMSLVSPVMSLINPNMNDLDMLKNKIDTKLSGIIKKNMKDINKVTINIDQVVPTELSVNIEFDEIGYIDEEKGKHIGYGIYLKHVDHLIKMTTPNFVCYY
jgi:hypothetical protein